MTRQRLSLVVTLPIAAFLMAGCSGEPSVEAAADPPPQVSAGDPDVSAADRPQALRIDRLEAGEILPAERRTEWNPGVTYGGGGIPHRDTVCVTLSPSGADDTAIIEEAIASCPDDQVVQLTAGTFDIRDEGVEIRRSRVTLRGAGPGEPGTGDGGTRLVKTDRESNRSWGVLYVEGGPDLRDDGYPFAAVELAEDAVKGTDAVRLRTTEGLEAGWYVMVDHVTSDDPDVYWSEQQGGPGAGERRWFNRQDRSLSQVMRIVAIDGDTVTLETPFHATFRTDFDAELVPFVGYEGGSGFVEWVGIEDLYLEGGMGGDYHGNLAMSNCGYCWVSNIESNLNVGTAVGLYSTYRSEVRDSYIHSTADPNPGGAGYLLGINYGAADNLIENNIVWLGNKVMVVRASGGGNVIAYNYMDDAYGSYYLDIPEVGLNAGHYTTPHMELFEGNLSFNYDGDSGWGNSIDITVFRNHLTGLRADAAGLGFEERGMRRIVGLDRFHYGYNFIGNVLGYPDMAPTGQEMFVYELTDEYHLYSDSPRPHVAAVWALGYNGDDLERPIDPQVAATTIRHGNYDFLTGSTVWHDQLPRELPDSLYLDAKPSFFGTHPWPWVNPEDGGATGILPAHERFLAIHGPSR